MIILKIIACALFVRLSFLLYAVARLGRKLASGKGRDGDLQLHRRATRRALINAVLVIVAVEVVVRVDGGGELSALFWVHLSFAVPFFVSFLALRLWVTGLRMRQYHRYVAYACFAFYVPALITGLILLYLM